VALFARMNPEWKDPEMVGAQLYECKQIFVLPANMWMQILFFITTRVGNFQNNA
jgi:hypothetical protein